MALTPFGKAVRKARLDADVTLSEMATALNVTSPFLSAMETGRKKVPSELVSKIQRFFAAHHVAIDDLGALADMSNNTVSLEGLVPEHQMMVAGFARVSYPDADPTDLEQLRSLLRKIGGK